MTVDLTNESYGQWLRAGRPPFEWFLGQDDETREQLAILGDEYARSCIIELGYAMANPVAAEAADLSAAGELEGEAAIVAALARRALGAMDDEKPAPIVDRPKMRPTGRKVAQ